MDKKAAFLTLGCKVNQYETNAMTEILESRGYTIVDFKEEADVYVINTCSVTNIADRKSRQMIHRARKKNPEAVVVAAGCYIQSGENDLLEQGTADILIGNNKKKDIADILDRYFREKEKICELTDLGRGAEYEPLFVTRVNDHTRAYLKIQDGCNQFCSYCIIPYTRGRIRSRQPGDILREVRQLADKGYLEIVLTGIHLSSYGKDLGTTDLLTLIGQLNEVEGIRRIRLGSLEPRIITESFVKSLKDCEKVCPHFHLSLQSGCDETLKRMNRKYDTREYLEAVRLLRRYYDEPALTTDIIVGFAGETDEEFDRTAAYLEEINLYEMHVFKFSVRKGTRAEKMPGQVDDKTKARRSDILLDMVKRHKAAFESSRIGRKESVLLEEEVIRDGKRYMQGYTERYMRVLVPMEDTSLSLKSNQIIDAIIKQSLDGQGMLGKVSIEF